MDHKRRAGCCQLSAGGVSARPRPFDFLSCVGMCGQAGAMGAFDNENEVAMTSARRIWACDLLCTLGSPDGNGRIQQGRRTCNEIHPPTLELR